MHTVRVTVTIGGYNWRLHFTVNKHKLKCNTTSISDLDLESAFRTRYRKFDLDFVYNFPKHIRNAGSNFKSLT